MWFKFLQKITKFLDPKLDKYREKKPTAKPKPTPKYTPKTTEEFIDLLRRTPKSILDDTARERISAVMSFDDRTIGSIMIPKSKMVFVNEADILGPLALDKLYKSGFTNFPVIDNRNQIKGVIHTEALNALEIKKTDRASKYLDPAVHYLHTGDSLKYAVTEIERTGSNFFIVLDDSDELAGFFTIQQLLNYLLG